MKIVLDISDEHLLSIQDIRSHLLICDEHFVPRLSSYVDIDQYVQKIHDCAKKIAIIDNGRIVALGAFYLTNRSCGFITNVSVDPGVHSCGFGKKILLLVEQAVSTVGMDQVELHVFLANSKAMCFYISNGYVVQHEDEGKAYLCKVLGH